MWNETQTSVRVSNISHDKIRVNAASLSRFLITMTQALVLINVASVHVTEIDMDASVNVTRKRLIPLKMSCNVIVTPTTQKSAPVEECADVVSANVSKNQWKRESMVSSVSVTTSVVTVSTERFAVDLKEANVTVERANAMTNGLGQLVNV